MSTPGETSAPLELPAWALERASADMYDVNDQAAVIRRAWEIVREGTALDDERHDEFDDPDEGGEA